MAVLAGVLFGTMRLGGPSPSVVFLGEFCCMTFPEMGAADGMFAADIKFVSSKPKTDDFEKLGCLCFVKDLT